MSSHHYIIDSSCMVWELFLFISLFYRSCFNYGRMIGSRDRLSGGQGLQFFDRFSTVSCKSKFHLVRVTSTRIRFFSITERIS